MRLTPAQRARTFVGLSFVMTGCLAVAFVLLGVGQAPLAFGAIGLAIVVSIGASGWGTDRPMLNRAALATAAETIGWSERKARWLYWSQGALVLAGIAAGVLIAGVR